MVDFKQVGALTWMLVFLGEEEGDGHLSFWNWMTQILWPHIWNLRMSQV